jgi:lipoate---protein ligase
VPYEIAKKIPNGKMIRLKIEAGDIITTIKITGDFFLHPEESIDAIEKNLLDMPINASAEEFAKKIHQSLQTEHAAFIGVTPEDIAGAMVESFNAK